jgi:hypothetical protein
VEEKIPTEDSSSHSSNLEETPETAGRAVAFATFHQQKSPLNWNSVIYFRDFSGNIGILFNCEMDGFNCFN